MVVKWSKGAELALDDIVEYIALDSPQNAEMVADSLVDATLDLVENPLKYPLDKLKKDNDGTWRVLLNQVCHYNLSPK